MERTSWVLAIAIPIAAAALTGAAQSAPIANLAAPRAETPTAETPTIEPIALRCWWRDGRRHCVRAYRYRERGYPEAYRTGTRNWWTEMDREGRGGRR
jgi:hypothetical protein